MASKTAKKGPGPAEHIAHRIERCREEMAGKKVEAYLLTNRMDSFYLSGCTAEDSALLLTSKQAHIISDGRFDESIDHEAPWLTKHLRKGMLVDEIGKVVRRLRLANISVQPDHVSVDMMSRLRKACSPVKIKKAPSIVNGLRRRKDEHEVATIEQAIRIAEDAFEATCKSIEVGQTEQDLAARLEYEMKRRGSESAAFTSIVAEGANASIPHASPGKRVVKEGSAILFDWGATVNFYHSDLTRVVAVGSMPKRIKEIYQIVLDAQCRAIDGVVANSKMCDVDDIARQHIKRAGFGDRFGHGLGHGLGLDVHEDPSLSWRSKERLEPGMVVTVEPGIYLPGEGGVRIEDDVLVTNNGPRVLSTLSKDLDKAVL